MSKLEEILKSGVAPFGRCGSAPNPTHADVAVPRAFRQMEQQGHSADKICRDAGFSSKQIKTAWNFKQKL